MRTRISRIVVVAALGALLSFMPMLHAAGSVSVTSELYSGNIGAVTITWTADASAATVPSTDLSAYMGAFNGWFLFKMDADVGTTAPTNLYDVTISNSIGDITGGALTDLLEAGNQVNIMPLSDDDYEIMVPVSSALTFALTNNSVNSATGTIKLYFVR